MFEVLDKTKVQLISKFELIERIFRIRYLAPVVAPRRHNRLRILGRQFFYAYIWIICYLILQQLIREVDPSIFRRLSYAKT